MKRSVGSFIGLNRRIFLLLGIVLSLSVLGIVGWGSIRQVGGQLAEMIAGGAEKSTSDTVKRREADDPDGREGWFMYQRMYPFDKVPDSARRNAFEEVRARGDGFGPSGAGATWTSIGPVPTAGMGPGGNVSGRINEIAISPANTQIILIAGSTGGIWRSTDGGTTFVPVSDSQVDVAVGAIAFAPSDSNIVYAGMGDTDNGYFGTGVLKSTDAGATWTRVSNNSLPDRGQSTSIRVDPADPNKVYLARFNSLDPANCTTRPCSGVIGGIYVSTDGGVSWTKTLTGRASDLAIHPTNPQIIYAALRFGSVAGDPRGLYKSIDGGTTWNNVFASPYTNRTSATKDFRIAVTPASPDRIYIYFGSDGPPAQVRLEMSEDAGATFTNRGVVGTTSVGLDPGQFGYNTFVAASPADANAVYVGGRDIFSSTDGGVNFTNINNSFRPPYNCGGCFTEANQKIHTDQQALAFMPGSPTTFFAGNDGGIFKTTDSGATFTSLNATLSLVQFVSIALHPFDGTQSYGGAQDNGSQLRTAGGSGWREFVGGDGGKVAINAVDHSMVFPSNTEGSISRVLNNGAGATASIAASTSFGEPASDARIEFYPPVVSNGVDARVYSGSWRLFICGDCNDINKEQGTANSTTWTAPGGTTDLTTGGNDVLTAIAVAKSDNNVIYTGSRDGSAMRSTDGGATWTNITAGLPTRSITNITVSVTDPTKIYLTVSGYGSGHVFSSTDGGTTWANISNGVPDIPTSAFLIDPRTATTLYAGTDIGVFRSTDNGASWMAFNNGLPPTPVMAFSSQATGRIQLSTYGRGAYELPAGSGPGVSVGDARATEGRASGSDQPTGAGSVDFTISLSAPSNQTVTVRLSTNSITATEGQDFVAEDDIDVVFPPNTLTRTFSVPVIEDPGDEPDETFALDVTGVTGAVVADGEGIGTIIDNDATLPTAVQFSAATFRGNESGSAAITVTRTGVTTGTSTVTVSTVAGGTARAGATCTGNADYQTTSQTVTFAAGSTTPQTVLIPLCRDTLFDQNETVNLALSNVSAGTDIGVPFTAVLTINDTANQFRNTTPIVITGASPASPYPSNITVAGATANVFRIRVTLYDLYHVFPDNIDVLLVGPTGVKYALMGDVGGPTALPGPPGVTTLTFADFATAVLPDAGPLVTGAFRPTTCETPVTSFPTPAPAAPYIEPGCTLARSNAQTLFGNFGGTNGNGVWSLYVRDDAGTAAPTVVNGEFSGGWGLELLPSTAAGVEVSGRVVTPDGRGLRNAQVIITDSNGLRRTATTSSFGYYKFEDVEVGSTFVVGVTAKRYRFAQRVVQVFDTLTDVDFVGQE